MAWTFPQDRPFDLITKEAQYLNCRFVAGDENHLTVERDYICILGLMHRLRTQVVIEDIHTVHEHAVVAAQEHTDASTLQAPAESRRG